jgi:uncharacterized protein
LDVEVDIEKGINYFKRSSELGSGEALNYLAKTYFHGVGVEKNQKLAVEYFKKAGDQGYFNKKKK